MDTLTHSLAGLVLGEFAARSIPTTRTGLSLGQRRGLYISLLILGSNLPDADFLYSLASGSKLDYLLHHRGHSHTLVGLVLGAALLFGIAWTWLRRKHWPLQRADLSWLAAASLFGPVLHVSMDFTNTYGVHPWWPFTPRWFFGDAVFIVEPLLWAAAMPVLALVQSNGLRLLIGVTVAAALMLLFSSDLVAPLLRVFLVVTMLGGLLLGHYCSPRAALITAGASWLAVTGTFLVAHGFAARTVLEFAARTDPEAILLDHILTPLPSNPLCWEVILVQLRAEQYSLRRATLALAPQWLTAADCPNRDLETAASAPLATVRTASTPQWQWFGEFHAERAELMQLADTRCEAAAFLRFSRAPWWSNVAGKVQLGDLRYDREPQAGFAEIELRDACPQHLPPWRPPRHDLWPPAAKFQP
jgi:inner membrane protein